MRLLQQGVQQALHWQIEATVVLELHPATTAVWSFSLGLGDRMESVVAMIRDHRGPLPCVVQEEGQELLFEMVEGDFEKYSGKWTLIPTEG